MFLGLSQNKMINQIKCFLNLFYLAKFMTCLIFFHEYGSLGGKIPAYQIRTEQKN